MSATQSPVVLSSYDPTGRYLCYVSIALDKQRISVEPTQKSDNYGLLNENFLYLDDSKSRVTSLKWTLVSSTETLCVLIGLSNGEIWLYSPLSHEILFKLSTDNSYEIKDIVVVDSAKKLYCIDSDDIIYEFDLVELKLQRHFKVESCTGLNRIGFVSENTLLLASHQIFLVDVAQKSVTMTFPGHVSPVTILEPLSKEYFISGAENDRFLNVYDIASGLTKSVLVSQANVTSMSHSDDNVIVTTTEDGSVEIFVDPLITNTNKRRAQKSKQHSKKISAIDPNNSNKIPLFNAFINKDILTVSYLQNATVPFFKQIQWKEVSDDYTIELDIAHRKNNRSTDRSLYGQDVAATKTYQEGNARVTSGDNFKHVEDVIKQLEIETSNHAEDDRESEPSEFESLADKIPLALSNVPKKKKKNPVTGTFAVVLTQALQSNDHSLLETVLNNRDDKMIRDTIMRIKPTLSVILLERLAERIARQSNRQRSLNIWVKWCLIIHGGYLVSVPNLTKTLSSLHATVKSRAALLDRLTALKIRLEYTWDRLEMDYTYGTKEEMHNPNEIDQTEEDDVEYNEELDDAGLIEDGEEDSGESYYEDSDVDESETQEIAQEVENGDVQEGSDDDEGYSDVEMNA
ncbi:hypothetical protein KAFR_0E02470 [Kazachstania africana CBS 2517]|uniref:Small-subunit processome Utp12 domain-containing protein n=1 Tax=Kazachstania africana (strain ATCC 22294 / BCRC 22015 / CBS 2517 / CECT 1963 / NBRC 1671 / NRRL Y-8276) TaxID=1071382 RepID=H2AVK0_KAZAF|nr:hypothetical protein KAFR_0E02470 [Kazachstania africana CBS 2517]CCF58400.1 hypothetical protein KAFR_0E02470 [Kazachstania africana CBS 2517]